MKKTKAVVILTAFVMMLSMSACTEDTGSSEKKTSSSEVTLSDSSFEVSYTSASSSAPETTTTTTAEETTTTTTTEETTTTAETTQTTAKQTGSEGTETFTNAIKTDIESCISGGKVDMFRLLEKWDINAGQVAWGGPDGRFMMQFRRDNADSKTECMVFSAKKDKNKSYTIYFGQRAADYPAYKVSYGEETIAMSGYDLVCLYRIAKYDDYSLCTTEPYVDMSLRYE